MTHGQVHRAITLEVSGLACGHGDVVLASGLTFSVPGGTALALRGANGVGKSTLLLTLAGLLPPLQGSIALAGYDPEDGPAFHHCGHRNAVRPRLSVLQTLDFWAAINGRTGLSPTSALDRLGLGAIAGLDAGYLSAGQQRRLALARLLVSQRPVWLLDEPLAALDAEGQGLVVTLLAEHLDAGGLAVIATHDDLALKGLVTLTLGGGA
jgi:heme ABC exporter, ATP-binding protein CcmA